MSDIKSQVESLCDRVKKAAYALARTNQQTIVNALHAIADAIDNNQQNILQANQKDLQQAKDKQLSAALIDRLTLTVERINAMSASIRDIAALPCPINKTLSSWQVKSRLNISRVSVPIGVIAVIYESRPNVTADAAALCLKSGNAVILRGGSDCALSNHTIMQAINQGLLQHNLPQDCVARLPTQDRTAVDALLTQHQSIDVVIPRGGKKLIQYVMEHSSIPLFKHLDGICHTYVHHSANKNMARDVIVNAKMRRPGICGATETVLIDKAIVDTTGAAIVSALIDAGCDVCADDTIAKLNNQVNAACEQDWHSEYLSAKVSLKTVADINEAIAHINHYGSHHTDAIICQDKQAAKQFEQNIDSAIVMHNCSTQFADGGEFGMGAEMGIATGKLHARGPVGIEQLTTFKYIVEGDGQIRDPK